MNIFPGNESETKHLIPLQEKIAKDFNLPIQKLELDYDTPRPIGHILTPHEIDYIRNDVEIMSRALDYMFTSGLNKMTIGSDALSNYKKIKHGGLSFSILFLFLIFLN